MMIRLCLLLMTSMYRLANMIFIGVLPSGRRFVTTPPRFHAFSETCMAPSRYKICFNALKQVPRVPLLLFHQSI